MVSGDTKYVRNRISFSTDETSTLLDLDSKSSIRTILCTLGLFCVHSDHFHMSCDARKTGLRGFRLGLRPVQLQKMARGLEFWIQEEEELYCSCSENKGADQLGSYCEADLRLCFRIDKNPVFS